MWHLECVTCGSCSTDPSWHSFMLGYGVCVLCCMCRLFLFAVDRVLFVCCLLSVCVWLCVCLFVCFVFVLCVCVGFMASSESSGMCSPCPAGQWNNGEGNTRCFPCPKMTYSAIANSTTCTGTMKKQHKHTTTRRRTRTKRMWMRMRMRMQMRNRQRTYTKCVMVSWDEMGTECHVMSCHVASCRGRIPSVICDMWCPLLLLLLPLFVCSVFPWSISRFWRFWSMSFVSNYTSRCAPISSIF